MSVYIETYYESLNKWNEELCGDTVGVVRARDSVVAVLADGLGSGVKANILSTLTGKIVLSMLSGGATIDEALETVVNTLPVCAQRGVAYCTFTMLQIFPDDRVYIAEFDNPELVILREGKRLEFPARKRFLSGKTIYERRFTAQPEDTFVVFSDGVIHAGVGSKSLPLGWLRKNAVAFLEEKYRPCVSAAALTRLLLSRCNEIYEGHPMDDTSVLTVRLRRPLQLNLMAGPPADPEKDVETVKKFMALPGLHAICGGSTSQMTSRILGRTMSVNLDYDDPKVPPTAAMEGIELVAEGALTLTRTLQYLEQYRQKGASAVVPGKNGAAQLARMLTDQCTNLHMMLGMARNPAHQNPKLPIDYDVKMRVLREIARHMEEMGKDVVIEYV